MGKKVVILSQIFRFSELLFGLTFKRKWALQQKIEVFKTFFGLILRNQYGSRMSQIKMKWDFVNIGESVREPYVPNLPGVQPRLG